MNAPRSEHTVGDIHVETAGSGPPLLLIHGNGEDLHYFDRNIPILARDHRVIAMDCRGQGGSARGTGPLTLARMAEDAARVIAVLGAGTDAGPQPFDIVGFSDGANVAMLLAVAHPELVRRLVLNAGNITVDGMCLRLRVRLRILDRYLRVGRRHRGSRAHEYELLRLMLDAPGIRPDDLKRLTAPTLVLAGSRDLIRRAHTRWIASLIPGARLKIIRPGRHTVLRDRAQLATSIVAEFLDEPG